MENSSKKTSTSGYSIYCTCRKCKQSMGVINYFSSISKLLSCVHITSYTHIGSIMTKDISLHAQVHDTAYQLCILHIHWHVLKDKHACTPAIVSIYTHVVVIRV